MIEYFRLILAIMPLVIEAVRTVESLFPETGQGQAKKDLVLDVIREAVTAKGDGLPAPIERVISLAASIVDKVVTLFNKTGQFKKA